MRLHDVEPVLGKERVVTIVSVVDGFLSRPRATTPGPFLLAIDGRSSNGKTSLAARLARCTDGAEVVHTDDIGSHYSFFDWDHLLSEEIVEPLRAGRSIAYRPPGYAARVDPVEIVLPASAPLVIVEGVGSARGVLGPLFDAIVWVQSDLVTTEERNRVRVEAGEMSPVDYAAFMQEEIALQARERTWERADLVVCGTPSITYDSATELVVLEHAE